MDTELDASPIGDQPSVGVEEEAESMEQSDDEDVEQLSDGEEDEDEDAIRGRHKLNSVATITSLRLKPLSSSRFFIPLCRMVAMPMVRPTLESDLKKLEQEFIHGYRDGAAVFYVSTTNEDGCVQEVTEELMASWGPLWIAENERFNSYLDSIPALNGLRNLMFFVCDGNHRRQAWMNHIHRLHKLDPSWHYSVDSIVLDTKDRISVVMQVMHDINKYAPLTFSSSVIHLHYIFSILFGINYFCQILLLFMLYSVRHTEDSHVKTNLAHNLFRVRKYGLMSIDKFTEVLSASELRKCKKNNSKTWYSLPLDVFTSFIFQVRNLTFHPLPSADFDWLTVHF